MNTGGVMNSNDDNQIYLLLGNASNELSLQIARYWGSVEGDQFEASNIVSKDIVMVDVEVNTFRDGEVNVLVRENIRGQDVFIIQSFYTSYDEVVDDNGHVTYNPQKSVNDYLMELLLMVDACKRASASSITAVIPYFGYARQDRKIQRAPISAKLVADMLTVAGVSRVLTMDLHAGQLQGFFNVPVDNLYGAVVAAKYISCILTKEQRDNMVVVSPDVGGAQRARKFRQTLELHFPENQRFEYKERNGVVRKERIIEETVGLAIIDKVRIVANESEVMHVIGDVKGKTVVIVDDLVDTAGTLCKGAQALYAQGAKEILAFCTHPVMSDKLDSGSGLTTVVEKLNASQLTKLYVSDTIPLRADQKACSKIEVISQDYMFATAIDCIFHKYSISQVFDEARSSSLESI